MKQFTDKEVIARLGKGAILTSCVVCKSPIIIYSNIGELPICNRMECVKSYLIKYTEGNIDS